MITLKIEDLKALELIAAKAKGDVKTYLYGVALSEGHLVAINGHVLGAVPVQGAPEDVEVIIPYDTVALAVKTAGKHVKLAELVPAPGDKDWYELIIGAARLKFRAIDAKYPDWQKVVVPKAPDPVHAHFDFRYLALFQKIGSVYGDGFPRVYPTDKDKAARVIIFSKPEFIGIIMPMKEDKRA